MRSDIQLTSQAFPDIHIRSRLQPEQGQLLHVSAFLFPYYDIVRMDEGQVVADTFEWGVIPTWLTDPKELADQRRNMCNARSEKILGDKRSVWYRLRNNRCLVPVTGTFEHRKIPGWKKKAPYLVKPKGPALFYLPGLYQVSEHVDEDGVIHTVGSFTLITRPANEVMRGIHNDGPNKWRMPLFLPTDLQRRWIAPDLTSEEMAATLAFELSSDQLEYYTVYTIRGGSLRPDGKEVDEPYTWDNLPSLGTNQASSDAATLF